MPEPLADVVQRVSVQVRWRRAEYFALRGLFYGAIVAVAALVLKSPLRGRAVPVALVAIAVGILAGALWGFVKRVPPVDAARLADRAFGLHDRIATALEWAARPDRTPLVDALVQDATARAASLAPRQIVGRRLPREARWLPAPLAVALLVLLAPPLPLPSGRLPDLTPAGESEETKERGEMAMMDQQRQPLPRDQVKRSALEERDFNRRAGGASAAMSGDLSAIFKDTSIANQRPDFNSFLKKGDERLRMLEQADRLPDLQSDYTASQYKMIFRRSKELTGGLRPDQISPQKLRELLDEMERLGRKNSGNWGSDVNEAMEALEGGQQDRAMDAMEKALNKMRALEERDRGGKALKGGRDASGRKDRGRGGAGMPDDQDFGEGEGSLPGKGKSASPKGEPSHRLRGTPYDVGVEGESRRGKKDGYDTNMTGKGGQMGSRLGYLGVIGQYRKMMEDSIAREQVPRDLHGQIKDYFQALEER
ncbi:MAG: hypothetical protein HY294_14300 [Candidatus Rokubacteria bacterium]|nr:hypothetical protein [Candidatus Rokubacteria bacterium]MBI3827159.1 hypothetical protein [Candidatus Rokubacteria bacterium]